MSKIGSSSLLIVPRFDNLTASINRAIAGVDTTSSGVTLGKNLSAGVASGTGGLVRSGALVGAFSSITSAAMDAISSHVSSAEARFDTLNNYPKVMETLGYSSDSAQASIKTMSDRLQVLPTRLDAMTSTVQSLAAITGDLNQATNVGLAVNDMLLAGGASTELANAAMEQFRQMLAKGKPEMQDWQSLTSAMPGQMKQLAVAMLGPTANANDLYRALGGGGETATISMNDLMKAMVDLDQNGGANITSFRQQAETASGGVQNSAENAANAVTRGLAGTMDAIGKENIVGAINDIKGAINTAFKVFNGAIGDIMPHATDLIGVVKDFAPEIAGAAAAMALVKPAGSIVSTVAGGVDTLRIAFSLAKEQGAGLGGVAELLAGSFNPATIAIGLAAAAIGALVAGTIAQEKHAALMKSATEGLSDAVRKSSKIASTSAGDMSSNVTKSLDAVRKEAEDASQAQADLADKIRQTTTDAGSHVQTLSRAEDVISRYMNQSELSATAQSQLKDAIQTVNDECGTQYAVVDAANGIVSDENGTIQDTTGSIDKYVEAKKKQIKIDAQQSILTDLYKQQYDDMQKLADAQQTLADKQKAYDDAVSRYGKDSPWTGPAQADLSAAQSAYSEIAGDVNTTDASIKDLNGEIDATAQASNAANDEMTKWLGSQAGITTGLAVSGQSVDNLRTTFENLGVSTDSLSRLSQPQLQQLASAYDGTTGSIADALEGMGITLDDSKVAALEALDQIRTGVSGITDNGALGTIGTSIDDLSQKLSDAGVKSDDLKGISSANFSAMLANCGGDVNSLVAEIKGYNGLTIDHKTATVNQNTGELVDAQGKVWIWNGTQMVPKDAVTTADTAPVEDATSKVRTFDGLPDVVTKHTDTQSDLTGANNAIDKVSLWNTLNPITQVFRTTYQTSGSTQSASGGIVTDMHADGGFIVTEPTVIGVSRTGVAHVAGEDGAEAIFHAEGGNTGIVPLSNRHYVAPFARAVADSMGGARDVAIDYGRMAMAMASALEGMGVTIDGRKLVGAISTRMDASLGQIRQTAQRGAM